MQKKILEKAANVELVVFDVDGVLTDGSIYIGDNGQEFKVFHARDGHGMKMLMGAGVDICIVTARTSNAVTVRMENLGIAHVYQGQFDKLQAIEDISKKLGLTYAEIAFVGDDVIDLPAMSKVGLAIAVADAHPFVKRHSHWQTPSSGGRGAAREVCDLIIEGHGLLDSALESYLRHEK